MSIFMILVILAVCIVIGIIWFYGAALIGATVSAAKEHERRQKASKAKGGDVAKDEDSDSRA